MQDYVCVPNLIFPYICTYLYKFVLGLVAKPHAAACGSKRGFPVSSPLRALTKPSSLFVVLQEPPKSYTFDSVYDWK